MANIREHNDHSSLDTSIFDSGLNSSKRGTGEEHGLLSFIIPKKGKKRRFFVFMLVSLLLFLMLNIVILTRQHGRNEDPSESIEQELSEIDRFNLPPNYTLITADDYFRKNNTHSFLFNNMSKFLSQGKGEIEQINLTVVLISNSEFQLTVDSSRHEKFKLPNKIFSVEKLKESASEESRQSKLRISELQYDIYIDEVRMCFKIVRNSTNETLFEVRTNQGFLFQETLTEFKTFLPNKYLYGLGQQRQRFLYQPGMYYIWGRGESGQKGPSGGHHLYGSHPMYLQRENSSLFHIVHLNNMNPKKLEFLDEPASLRFSFLGGAIDLKFFLADGNPERVLADYHRSLGGWRSPTLKLFGLHMGFRDLNQSDSESLANDLNVPKIDYLWIDKVNEASSENDMSLALTNIFGKIEFGVPLDSSLGRVFLDNEALVYSAKTQKPLLSCVDGVLSIFPDYNSIDTKKILAENVLASLSKQISGVFLTNNEPHTDGKGPELDIEYLTECSPETAPEASLLESFNNSAVSFGSSFQFELGKLEGAENFNAVEKFTLSLDSFHNSFDGGRFFNFTDLSFLQEINLHSLNSLMQAYTIYEALVVDMKKEDAFIFSEATAPGIGRVSGYFARSLKPTWDNLQKVISEVLNFQLFGVPIVALPSCGSEVPGLGASTEELCARWLQLSSVLPVLMHYSNEYTSALNNSKPANYVSAVLTKNYEKLLHSSIRFRYSISPYLWATYIMNSPNGAVYKPVFFEHTHDLPLLEIDNQFLIGSALMIAAVVIDSKESIEVYFPKGVRFVNLLKNETYLNSVGMKIEVNCEIYDRIPVFLREGHAISLLNVNETNEKLSFVTQEYTVFAYFNQSEDPKRFTAKGYMVGVNCAKSGRAESSCGQECLLNFEITATMSQSEDGGTGYNIEFLFKKAKEAANVEFGSIFITGLRCFGLKSAQAGVIKHWVDIGFERSEVIPDRRISARLSP